MGVKHSVRREIMSRYIIADPSSNSGWSHLFLRDAVVFGRRQTVVAELQCRFIYDAQECTLLHLDIQEESVLSPASREDLWDLQDSLENANPDAIASPEEWGLTRSTQLPEWYECNDESGRINA
jgi:hypothetical protein